MDSTALTLSMVLISMGIGLGWAWATYRKPVQPSGFLERILTDPTTQLLALTVVYLAVGLGASVWLIYLLMTKQITDAGIAATVGAAVGTILTACLVTPAGYYFGGAASGTHSAKALAEIAKEP